MEETFVWSCYFFYLPLQNNSRRKIQSLHVGYMYNTSTRIVHLQGLVTNTTDGFVLVVLVGHNVVAELIAVLILFIEPMMLKLGSSAIA